MNLNFACILMYLFNICRDYQAVRLYEFIHWIEKKLPGCCGRNSNSSEDDTSFLDKLVRCSPCSKKDKIKQDPETNRWYLRLEDAEVKAIRAVIWQQSRE